MGHLSRYLFRLVYNELQLTILLKPVSALEYCSLGFAISHQYVRCHPHLC